MSKFIALIAGGVAALMLVSAVGVIWSKHQARTSFIALQRLQNERDQLDTEWGQLKIEQSFWSTPGRVEKEAYAKLNMVVPVPTEVRIVQP